MKNLLHRTGEIFLSGTVSAFAIAVLVIAASIAAFAGRADAHTTAKPHLPGWFHYATTSDHHHKHPCLIVFGGNGRQKAEICSDGFATTKNGNAATATPRTPTFTVAIYHGRDGHGFEGGATCHGTMIFDHGVKTWKASHCGPIFGQKGN